MIRLLLVDDQALFREGLRTLLSLHDDVTVVGEAGDGEEALRVAAATSPDVVLMDLKMPVLDGVAATRELRARMPSCRIVALTTFEDDALVFDALRSGAVGYLLKDVSSERLVEAVRAASRGESFLQPSVAAKVVAELARLSDRVPAMPAPGAGDDSLLSPRELDVVRELARGSANKEIATALRVAEGTVKNHVTNIFRKLRVDSRTATVLRAYELGLLEK